MTTRGQRLRDLEVKQGIYSLSDPLNPANVLLVRETADNLAQFQLAADQLMSTLNAAASRVRGSHGGADAPVRGGVAHETDAVLALLTAIRDMLTTKAVVAAPVVAATESSAVAEAHSTATALHGRTVEALASRDSVVQVIAARASNPAAVAGLLGYDSALLARIDERLAVWIPAIDHMRQRLQVAQTDPGSWSW